MALLIRGADLEFSTPRGVRNKDDIVVFEKGMRHVHAAALAGDIGPLRLLLDAGATPSPVDARGRMPLCLCGLHATWRVVMRRSTMK